jgi:hypothetical protein
VPDQATAGIPAYTFGPVEDLHLRYSQLCRSEPVTPVWMPHAGYAWLITGYPELRQFLADPRFSSLQATEPDTARVTPLSPGSLFPSYWTRTRRRVQDRHELASPASDGPLDWAMKSCSSLSMGASGGRDPLLEHGGCDSDCIEDTGSGRRAQT